MFRLQGPLPVPTEIRIVDSRACLGIGKISGETNSGNCLTVTLGLFGSCKKSGPSLLRRLGY